MIVKVLKVGDPQLMGSAQLTCLRLSRMAVRSMKVEQLMSYLHYSPAESTSSYV